MIRRLVLVAATAAALVLAPSTAMAYPPPGFATVVTDVTPAAGAAFGVHMSNAKARAAVTLALTHNPVTLDNHGISIAGTKSLSKITSAAGVADFTVSLTEIGAYSLVATDAAGAVLSSQIVTVHAVGAAPAAAGGKLSRTGFDATGLAVGGGLLVLAGAGAVVVAKRRKSSQVSV